MFKFKNHVFYWGALGRGREESECSGGLEDTFGSRDLYVYNLLWMTKHRPQQQATWRHEGPLTSVLRSPTAITASPFLPLKILLSHCSRPPQPTVTCLPWLQCPGPPPSQQLKTTLFHDRRHTHGSDSILNAQHHISTVEKVPILAVPHTRLGCVLWMVWSVL